MIGTRVNDLVSNVVNSTAGLFLENGHLELKQASQTFYADGVESIDTLKNAKSLVLIFNVCSGYTIDIVVPFKHTG